MAKRGRVTERADPRKNKTAEYPRRDKGRRYYSSPSISPERDEEEPSKRCPLSPTIQRAPLPRGLEKPPSLTPYDGTIDPDDHLENVEAALDYRNVGGSIRCRVFPTMLRKGALDWYKKLAPGL